MNSSTILLIIPVFTDHRTILFLWIFSESVDVNVTPDKRQVFLQSEKLLLATVKVLDIGYFCTYAPRLDISLKKIPQPSNLHTTYLSRYPRRWYSRKNIFQPEVFFSSNLQTSKYTPSRLHPVLAWRTPDVTHLPHVMCVTD